jgi:hypothetical protein
MQKPSPRKAEGFALKKKRFSVEQIAAVMKRAEAGVPVAELIRKVGISEAARAMVRLLE